MTILVLIESPGKLKKIQSFLGNNFDVMATMGHIRQLPQSELGFDIENNYEPSFETIPDKSETVRKIKAAYKKADKVILAADMDREGSSIAWHSAEVLKLPLDKRYRATYTEITKNAVCSAIDNTLKNDTKIDMNQVYSQFARMILDKLIGYKISPLLWKEFNNYHLSCGRVQSPVVRLIAERENEIAQFKASSFYRLDAKFQLTKPISLLDKDYNKTKIKYLQLYGEKDETERTTIETLYNECQSETGITWRITNLAKTDTKRNPSPPFITSTLQQEASVKLGMSPDVCMKTAQKLYEAGLITYMRTDALFIAADAKKAIKDYIISKWGEPYYREMNYKGKNVLSQEAHECCRPTDISKEFISGIDGITTSHIRLYKLIWRRTVACQMSPANVEIMSLKITGDNTRKSVFIGKFEKIIFQGFLKCSVNTDGPDADGPDADGPDADGNKYLESIYAKLRVGQEVWLKSIMAEEKYTKPPHARYTEASLIKKLDDLGIGRPSTYANMIKKVQEEQRQYVERRDIPPEIVKLTSLEYIYPSKVNIDVKDGKIAGDKNKLMPTSLGVMINEYLEKHFMDIINYETTAQIEALLDEVATGSKIWYNVVDTVYIKLNPVIDTLSRAVASRRALSANTPDSENENKKLLGYHPDNQMPVYALKTRKGFLICESHPEKTACRFANFTGRFDSMTLDKALKLLIYPRVLGNMPDGSEIVLKKAKKVYLFCNGINYSIENYVKIHPDIITNDITLSDAIRIVEYYKNLNDIKKEMAALDRVLNEDIIIKKGPYGPYIKYQNTANIPLPKKMKEKWESITLEECLPIVEKRIASGKPIGKINGKKKAPKIKKI